MTQEEDECFADCIGNDCAYYPCKMCKEEYKCKASNVEIIQEFYHPAGPVTYTTFNNVVIEGGCGLFTMTIRDEWRTK